MTTEELANRLFPAEVIQELRHVANPESQIKD